MFLISSLNSDGKRADKKQRVKNVIYISRKLGRIADLSCKLIYVPKPSCNGRNCGEDGKNVDVAITQLST